MKDKIKKIEFGELRIGEDAKRNLLHCVETNWATAGPKVKKFEEDWGLLFDYKFNKAVSSGTDAVMNLVSSLYDLGAKRGDSIIVPALSFVATANAVLQAGFTPIFVDVDKDTMNIDPYKIEAAITDRTRAILVVHTMGRPCEMKAIREIADKHHLYLFEDACEAHGAQYQTQYIGSFGDGAAFSFYVAHLICCGEGGMVSTNNDAVANAVHSTRTHGRRNGDLYFNHDRVGYNSKMNDMEASLGLEGISNFWATFHTRKHNLYELMRDTKKYRNQAYFSREDKSMVLCPHAFSIVLKDHSPRLNELCDLLDENGIHWKRNFGCIPTQHKAYEFMGHRLGEFPEAEYVGNYGIHIGVHQYITTEELTRITEVLSRFFQSDIRN